MAAGFIAAAFWFRTVAVDSSPVAGVTCVAAACVVFRPQLSVVPSAVAGLLGGAWLSILWTQGIPVPAATAAAIALPAASAWLSARQPSFAPPLLREEAAMFVLVLAAIVAAAPAILDGWRSAIALNIQTAAPHIAMPSWTGVLAGSAIGLGGVFAVWRRG